jgi:hypothetical protein
MRSAAATTILLLAALIRYLTATLTPREHMASKLRMRLTYVMNLFEKKDVDVGSQVSVDAPDARRCPTTASILLRSDLH